MSYVRVSGWNLVPGMTIFSLFVNFFVLRFARIFWIITFLQKHFFCRTTWQNWLTRKRLRFWIVARKRCRCLRCAAEWVCETRNYPVDVPPTLLFLECQAPRACGPLSPQCMRRRMVLDPAAPTVIMTFCRLLHTHVSIELNCLWLPASVSFFGVTSIVLAA